MAESTPDAQILHVACAADARYVAHSAAMLHSVLTHRGAHEVQIHYLHPAPLDTNAADRLRALAEPHGGRISFWGIAEEQVAGLPEMTEVTRTMWFRIYLPELLPDVDRVLYLDVDTIALDSIVPLWEVDLADSYVAAVTNVCEPWDPGRPQALGLPDSQPYFNSGVLLMNLEAMRRDACTQAIREYAMTHGHSLVWPDQDTLNVVLGPRHVPLHPRWNCMNSVLHSSAAVDVFGQQLVSEARRSPAIRHFEGPSINKPWHLLCEWGWRASYHEHRRQTPWPDYRLEGVTPRNMAIHVGRRLRGKVARRVTA